MCQKESWGAIFATKEAHSTQRDQPPRMHGPGLWRYEQKEQRVSSVHALLVNILRCVRLYIKQKYYYIIIIITGQRKLGEYCPRYYTFFVDSLINEIELNIVLK